jgi:cytosine/adenosine deaminase-related metal-dependent hydrolase
MTQALHIKNARVWNDVGSSEIRPLFTKNGRIVDSPAHDAPVVDLGGLTIFPGLINAHDHLELNHYPRTKFREKYNNAHEWGEDVNARLNDEPFKSLRAYPLWDRVFIGGLKNLLCGTTTVVHHGPPHKPMFRRDFPVRVLKKYGWAHSLHFSTDEEIVRSYRSTPKEIPWFIHLAEGTDAIAAGELERLNQLGCVGDNTVLIHGVGITSGDVIEKIALRTRLVYCPSTNLYLLEQLPDYWHWNVVHIANQLLGSDSRLTADGDFLDELTCARQLRYRVVDMLYEASELVFGAKTGWNFNVGSTADFIAIPQTPDEIDQLTKSKRADLTIIVYRGVPQIGRPEVMAKFRHVQTVACTLDGVEKRIHIDLARQIHQCKLKERGLVVDALPKNQRYWRLF